MIVLSANGKKLMDVVSVFVSERMDKDDRNSVYAYEVRGMLPNGRTEVLSSYKSEEEAMNAIYYLAMDVEAKTRLIEKSEA